MTALTLRRTEEQGCLTQKYENKTELKILKKKTKTKKLRYEQPPKVAVFRYLFIK